MRLTKHEFRNYFGLDVGAVINDLLENDGKYLIIRFGNNSVPFEIDISGDDVILYPVYTTAELGDHYKRLV